MRPRHLGGLGVGVADLRRAGVALRLRWPWPRRTDHRRSWQGLPERDERAVVDVFRMATVATVGNGESTLFWVDNWLQGESIRNLAPSVFAAVPKRRRSCTVLDALSGRAWINHIRGPRTLRLLAEFVLLSNRLEHVLLTPGTPDTFTW